MEHIERRVKAIADTKQDWSPDKKALFAARIREAIKQRPFEMRLRFSRASVGRAPWNKGNNWRDGLTSEEVRAVNARRARIYRAKRPMLRIHARVSTMLRYSLGTIKAGRTWEDLVGYTREELIDHLEAQFQPGMTWNNMREWHIDHIIPRSAFQFVRISDKAFRDCWALANLRPLWAIENLKKGNRMLAARA